MTKVKKMFSVFALAALLFVGVGVAGAEARTVERCNNDTPPVCEKISRGGSRSPMFFFKELGITIAPEVAREAWRHPAIRDQVIALWRVQTFGR